MSKDARSNMEYGSHEWFVWWFRMIVAKENASLKKEAQSLRYGEVVT